MNTYAFMAQKLTVIVFLQILMWALLNTVKGRVFQIQDALQIEEGKHVYHIYTFVLNADVSNRGDMWIK